MLLPAWLGALMPSVPSGSFSNSRSFQNSGTATSTAGHVNFGLTSGIATLNVAPNANEFTVAFWWKRNGRDGVLFSNRTDSAAGLHLAISSGSLNGFVGGNFLSGGSGLGDGNWHLIVLTVRNESGTYTARLFADGNTSSIANASAGSAVNSTIDVLMGHRRGSDNATYSFGAYTNGFFDEVTFWNAGMTGTQAAELYNSGTPMDPNDHSQSANLTNWYRMGDGDTSPTITDNVGSVDATIINTGTGVFATDVP